MWDMLRPRCQVRIIGWSLTAGMDRDRSITMNVRIFASKDRRTQPSKQIGELEVDDLPRNGDQVFVSPTDWGRLAQMLGNLQPNGYGQLRFEMVCDEFTLTGCHVADSRGIVDYIQEIPTAAR